MNFMNDNSKKHDTGSRIVNEETTMRHLELVQSVVSRMATNSFLLKGWSVTLAAGLFALAAKDSRAEFLIVAYLPTVAFWALDAYYLRQERLFRCIYNAVRKGEKVEPFTLDTGPFNERTYNWFRTLVTPSIIAVHGTIVLLIFAVSCVLRRR